MKKEQFSEFVENLKYEMDEWLTFGEIESIVFSDGRGIYPNWKHMRFKITDKGNNILIQHGNSVPYGARLSSIFSYTTDKLQLSFPPASIISPSEHYSEFRNPKAGDILRVTNGSNNVLSESLIESVISSSNSYILKLVNPMKLDKDFRLSFYDPTEFSPKECMHSSEVEGIYMKFIHNSKGKDNKPSVYHEYIKVKDIKEITLKLLTKNKTYTIRG